jgi:hypothetical protein
MIVAELQRFYRELGTWEKVEQETGLTARRARTFINIPGKGATASPRTRRDITRARERREPFPLVEHMRLAREAMVPLKQWPGDEGLRKRIIEIEGMLHDHHPKSIWGKASRCYLLGFTATSRALHHNNQHNWFGGPSQWCQAINEAERSYEEGRAIIGQGSHDLSEIDVLKRLDYALFNNWLVAIAGGAKMRGGRSRDETNRLLLEANALSALRQFLEQNPFLWQAAVNGLELASTLALSAKSQDEMQHYEREMLYFYEELKRLDRGFQSFDYSPGEVPAISKEPGMAYFSAQFRNRLHVDNPTH